MQYLRDSYGAREIFFADDIFLLARVISCSFADPAPHETSGLRWIGQMRADRVDRNIAEAMAQAGCQRIYFGVESGSEAILQRAKKGDDQRPDSSGGSRRDRFGAASQNRLDLRAAWVP